VQLVPRTWHVVIDTADDICLFCAQQRPGECRERTTEELFKIALGAEGR
jgi:hypothetical protein